jgi:hypothetical protein
MITTIARDVTLRDLYSLLERQQAYKVDLVVPARKMRFSGAQLVIEGVEAAIDVEGVTEVNGFYAPTDVFDEGISGKLGIPLPYVRQLRKERADLYDANANGWLHSDDRSFMVRLFVSADGSPGIARAMLSDKYRIIDNLDVLTAILRGIKEVDADIEVKRCDLSERNMLVKIWAPSVRAHAGKLFSGYTSPYSGLSGDELPFVFAGFVARNSETGNGRNTLTAEVTAEVCTNGMTQTQDVVGDVHLGGKMDEGVVRWSSDTMSKHLELVTAKARDAAKTFLDADYLATVIERMTQVSGRQLVAPGDNVVKVSEEIITKVAKVLAFDKETTDGVLDHFIRGGLHTSGGVMHAVTSYAQRIDDPDKALTVNQAGVRAMELAALS